MIILGIETSCDETGICLYEKKKGIISNKIYSQSKIHSLYGGIVPTIASRNHSKKIILLIKKIIEEKKINFKYINAIAFTAGPGLPNSLLIGATIAKTLSLVYKKPSIPINHIEGHIMSVFLSKKKKPNFPFISLITSGAHTFLIIVKNYGKYKIIGHALDDSAGEVFDKIGNLIGLKYPGGKKISKLAKYGKKNFNFPKPMINKNNFNFSFSGLKTHVSYFIKKNKKKINQYQFKCDICLSLEESITEILVYKSNKALKKFNIKNISIVGGVSANNRLRKKMTKMAKKNKIKIFFTKKKLCTDNAAMIAYTGLIKFKKKKKYKNIKINIKPRWNINKKF